jgi:transposase-like protein
MRVAVQCYDMTKRSKKAWTKWRKLVSEQARSGQSVKAFCREHGLCRPCFFVWKKRLQEGLPMKFLEVQVTEHVPNSFSDAGVEIRLKNGRSLMVRAGFDAEHVRVLLAVVEAAG